MSRKLLAAVMLAAGLALAPVFTDTSFAGKGGGGGGMGGGGGGRGFGGGGFGGGGAGMMGGGWLLSELYLLRDAKHIIRRLPAPDEADRLGYEGKRLPARL